MQRLSGTDALFLALETPAWHQHVAGLSIVDPQGGDLSFERVRRVIAERIPLAPKFTWKLHFVPLHLDRPMWVDDPTFSIDSHLRRAAVPSPGGPRETAELAGMLASTQLDRNRPLWEMWYLEGLANGRIGLFMKYHHCLLDGVAGASLATVLMDLEPEPASPPETPADLKTEAGPAPSNAGLLFDAARAVATRPVKMARYGAGMVGKAVTAINSVRSDAENRALLRAPRTPFNAPIGPRRGFAFASVSLDDLKAVKKAHDVKINDVVMAVCAGAFRRYLLDLGELPDEPLVSGVPVSTRAEGDTSDGNQITTMFVSLGTDLEDPVERLRAIYRSSQSAKAMTSALSARQIQSIGEVASPLIIGTAIRAVYQTQAMVRGPLRINTLISNVPGPPIPLYSCGGRLMGMYASSVILEGMGVNVTAISYMDRLDFGVHVDPDLVPDPWLLTDQLGASLAELMEASGLGAPTPVEDPFGDWEAQEAKASAS